MSEYNEWNQYKQMKPKRRGIRRIGALALSAVMFGGIAGLAFNSVSNINRQSTEAAEQEKTETNKAGVVQTSTSSGTQMNESSTLGVTDIAEAVMPSIVSITNKSVAEVQEYYGMFGGRGYIEEQEVESAGSGIIIGQNDEELLLVTNNHVIEDASTITVGFTDGNAVNAMVKGTNKTNDLAVLAVDLDDISDETMATIKIAVLGSSDNLQVGEQVVAIGNALGYGQSVTTGIVSALDRQIDEGEESASLIQTDAAINPGNSGGALINMNGEVIGINSAKFASTEIEGMGYAIPINTAIPILEELMNRETREVVANSETGVIGISGVDVSSEVQAQYGIPAGIYVSEVSSGSAAENAGIKKGDIITGFDGTGVTGIESLTKIMQYYAAGETVEITLMAADGNEYSEKTVTLTLDAISTDSSER